MRFWLDLESSHFRTEEDPNFGFSLTGLSCPDTDLAPNPPSIRLRTCYMSTRPWEETNAHTLENTCWNANKTTNTDNLEGIFAICLDSAVNKD